MSLFPNPFPKLVLTTLRTARRILSGKITVPQGVLKLNEVICYDVQYIGNTPYMA